MVCLSDVFAKNLRRTRMEKGMTMAQLAEKAGVAASGVCRWETGKWSPTLHSALCLAEALGCTIDDLVRGEDDG